MFLCMLFTSTCKKHLAQEVGRLSSLDQFPQFNHHSIALVFPHNNILWDWNEVFPLNSSRVMLHQKSENLSVSHTHMHTACNSYLPYYDQELRQLGSWSVYEKGNNPVPLPAEGAAWATQISLVDSHRCWVNYYFSLHIEKPSFEGQRYL